MRSISLFHFFFFISHTWGKSEIKFFFFISIVSFQCKTHLSYAINGSLPLRCFGIDFGLRHNSFRCFLMKEKSDKCNMD